MASNYGGDKPYKAPAKAVAAKPPSMKKPKNVRGIRSDTAAFTKAHRAAHGAKG